MARKERRRTEKTEGAAIVGVGGVIYRHAEDGEIDLLLIRKRDGYWTLPKGKLKPGEEPPAALAREVAEETGLAGEVGTEVRTVSYITPRRRPAQRKVVTYYLFRATDGALQLCADEGIAEARWVSLRASVQRIRRRRVRRVVRDALILLRGASEMREAA